MPRRVSKVLTVQYDRVIYLLEDTPANHCLIHNYLDVFESPDGRVEIRVNGAALPCVHYDQLSEIDQAANLRSSVGGASWVLAPAFPSNALTTPLTSSG